MNESLQISREGRVLHAALNRPDKRNALNLDLCRALAETFDEAEADPGVGAVLLSGHGKSFCAGMDLKEALSTESNPGPLTEIHERIFTAGIRMTKPVVAAVQGAALAGGTGLAVNCHFRPDGNPAGALALHYLSRRGGGCRGAPGHRTGLDRPDLQCR
jgi:enoyl-CoA hydratase/carnithine racemase